MGGSSWGGELVREGAPITRGVQAEAHRRGCLGGLQGAAATRDTPSEETAQTHLQAWGRGSGRNQAGKGGGPGAPVPATSRGTWSQLPSRPSLPVSKAGAIKLLCKELFGPWLSTGALGMLFHFILVMSFHVGAPLILILTDREPRP